MGREGHHQQEPARSAYVVRAGHQLPVDSQVQDVEPTADALLRAARTVLGHQVRNADLQARLYRDGNGEPVQADAAAGYGRVQPAAGGQGDQLPIDHVFGIEVNLQQQQQQILCDGNMLHQHLHTHMSRV